MSARWEPRLVPATAWTSSTITVSTPPQRLPGLGGEDQEQRLGRGDQDVGRVAGERSAVLGRGVAGADGDGDLGRGQAEAGRRRPHPGQRGAQVALDVDGQRLERARRTGPGALRGVGRRGGAARRSRAHRNAARVLPEPVGATTSASGRGDGLPGPGLGGGRRGERVLEPGPGERREALGKRGHRAMLRRGRDSGGLGRRRRAGRHIDASASMEPSRQGMGWTRPSEGRTAKSSWCWTDASTQSPDGAQASCHPTVRHRHRGPDGAGRPVHDGDRRATTSGGWGRIDTASDPPPGANTAPRSKLVPAGEETTRSCSVTASTRCRRAAARRRRLRQQRPSHRGEGRGRCSSGSQTSMPSSVPRTSRSPHRPAARDATGRTEASMCGPGAPARAGEPPRPGGPSIRRRGRRRPTPIHPAGGRTRATATPAPRGSAGGAGPAWSDHGCGTPATRPGPAAELGRPGGSAQVHGPGSIRNPGSGR